MHVHLKHGHGPAVFMLMVQSCIWLGKNTGRHVRRT